MTPVERIRLEKAAADCGFEMTPIERDGGMELRSARFPETVHVRIDGPDRFVLTAYDGDLLNTHADERVAGAEGYSELYGVLRTAAGRARTRPNRVAELFHRHTFGMPRTTEAERMLVQRVGQDLFRAALIDYWQGRCCVTGLDIPELLRASHIKPWGVCETDEERLDVFNGLLLAPQLDALFDAGFMTVEDDGTVRVSAAITPTSATRLGLSAAMKVSSLGDGHRRYLVFHHANVWRG